jgi:PD-(D/E)XK endonuclease
MAPLKLKGDRAELEVARDLIRRGYRIAIPYGEDWDFDLIFSRPGSHELERVQVKYTESKGDFISVRPCSQSLTNGKVKRTKRRRPSTGLPSTTSSPTAVTTCMRWNSGPACGS